MAEKAFPRSWGPAGKGLLDKARSNSLLWLVPVGLISLYFVLARIHFLIDFSEASYSPYFWVKRYATFLHISGGAVALGLGLAQVWLGMTRRTGALHRQLGWAYVAAVAISVVSAMWMVASIPGHFAYASGLFLNAVVWGIATAMAIWAIRRRKIDLHREWMLLSYLMALAFTVARMMLPAFRAFVEVPSDPIADDIQAATAWACWVVPMFCFYLYRSSRILAR